MVSLSFAWVLVTLIKKDFLIEFRPVWFLMTGVLDIAIIFACSMLFSAITVAHPSIY